MHKSFLPLFAIALLGIATTAFVHDDRFRLLGLVAGLLPLAKYHWNLFKQGNLDPDQIDSVYYFGFLITVTTLVAATVSLGQVKGQLPLSAILVQFGLGLVATAYGLFARLHLLANAGGRTEGEMASSTERLAKSVEQAAAQFDKAGFEVAAFVMRTNERMQSIEGTFRETENRFKSLIDLSAKEYKEKLRIAGDSFAEELASARTLLHQKNLNVIEETTSLFSLSIALLQTEFERLQSEAAKISFVQAATKLENLADSLNASISTVVSASKLANKEAADALGELTSAARKTLLLVNKISGNLDSISGVEDMTQKIYTATVALSGITNSAEAARASVSSLSNSLLKVDAGVNEILLAPNVTGEFARSIVQSSERLNKLSRAIETTISATQGSSALMAQKIPQASLGFGKLLSTIEQVNTSFESADLVATQLRQLSATTQRASEALVAYTAKITEITPATVATLSQAKKPVTPPVAS